MARNPTPFEETAPTKVDLAASEACSRAGGFVLLLSVALLSVIPFWRARQDKVALGRYISLRLSLETAVDLLDQNVYWQKYKLSNFSAESMPLSQLIEVRVEGDSTETNILKPRSKTTLKAGQQNAKVSTAPTPPTLLRIIVSSSINEIEQITKSLVELDDAALLTKSRSISPFYNAGIYRWALKRNSLVSRNIDLRSCQASAAQEPRNALPLEYYVPRLGREMLLKCLTLSNIRDLAHFEVPSIPDTTKFGSRGEGDEVDISPGSFPKDLFWASLLSQAVMIFVIIYFNSFVREAVTSANFPSPGTLFGAFSRSPWTLAAFGLILWLPFLASTAVAYLSSRWQLTICTALIGCVLTSTTIILARQSYWGTLDFGLFKIGKRWWTKGGEAQRAKDDSRDPDAGVS